MMATARSKKTAPDDAPPDNKQTLPEIEDTPDDIAVADLLAELGDTAAMVRVYRQGKTARDLELIDEVPVADFSPMMLAYPPYDGGTFRIHARSDGGIIANRVLRVQRKSPAHAAPDVSAVLTPAGVADMIAQALARALPAAMAPADTEEKILQRMKMMRDIIAPAGSPATVAPSINDRIGELSQLLTLGRMLNPAPSLVTDNDGKPDLMSTMLSKGIDVFGKIMEGQQMTNAARLAGGAPQVMLPNPTPALPATEQDANEMQIIVKFALKRACDAAAGGEAPDTYADGIYDDIPEEVLQSMATETDWFARLVQLVPACANHAPWFSQVRDALIRIYTEETAGSAAPHGQNLTDVPAPGNNGAPSTPGAADGTTLRTAGDTAGT